MRSFKEVADLIRKGAELVLWNKAVENYFHYRTEDYTIDKACAIGCVAIGISGTTEANKVAELPSYLNRAAQILDIPDILIKDDDLPFEGMRELVSRNLRFMKVLHVYSDYPSVSLEDCAKWVESLEGKYEYT